MESKNKKTGFRVSGVCFWIFVVIGAILYALSGNYNNEGLSLLAWLFFLIAGICLFIWLVAFICSMETEETIRDINARIDELEKKVGNVQLQNERIAELRKQIEELKSKS